MTVTTGEPITPNESEPHLILRRRSFIEYDARTRAESLLDPGSMRVLCGPFDRLESPWLEPQGIVPQADDGVVIARGKVGGNPVVVASIEQRFQGGGIGEVSGAKISQALRLAAKDSRGGTTTAALLLLETGGVRLQEANLGLNANAEIFAAILDLRRLAPVVGVVAGEVGCFGGMGIAAGLCTQLIVTREGRIGLNGPAVIEQEGGIEELDSSDRALVWAIDGGEQRHATGLADHLVPDDADALRETVREALAAGVIPPGEHRSERIDLLRSRLTALDPGHPPTPGALRTVSRGHTWLATLAEGAESVAVIPSVLRADTADAVYLAVVPDPDNPFHRARQGEVGLTECLALSQTIRRVMIENVDADRRRAIVAVVDLPSQAYGRIEETAGLHQSIAATVDAYASARTIGHPVVSVVVGTALSGGFLAHGLQAQQIIALDDPGVEIHAMHKPAAARLTLRTVEELNELAERIAPLSYDVRDWARLGFCDALLPVTNADAPTPADAGTVRDAVAAAIERARRGPRDLSNRLDSPAAIQTRAASRSVRDWLTAQWPA